MIDIGIAIIFTARAGSIMQVYHVGDPVYSLIG